MSNAQDIYGIQTYQGDLDAGWLADILDSRLAACGPRDRTITIKLSLLSAQLLSQKLRKQASINPEAVQELLTA